MELDKIPLCELNQKTHRLISSRHPTVGVFDTVADNDQLKAAILIEQLTNPRNTKLDERLARIPKQELVLGKPGATLVMAAFIHTYEEGGRFHQEDLGAWYAAFRIETAIKETTHHNYVRLSKSRMDIRGTIIQLRELISKVNASFHDIRGVSMSESVYDRGDYSQSQLIGAGLRNSNSNGICFRSVRDPEGENVVVFKPSLLPPIQQGDHYQYEWNSDTPDPVVNKLTNLVR